MHAINITVDAQRHASAPRGAGIRCNNSDQIITFEIDAASGFDLTAPITAVFVTKRGALPGIQFSAGSVTAPVLTYNDGALVYIGLTQGDIKTSSPAKLDVFRSIFSEAHGHEAEPDPGDSSLPIVTEVTLDDLVRISDVEHGRQVLITLQTLAETIDGTGSSGIFRAVYGDTTPSEIRAAIEANKLIVLDNADRVCLYDSAAQSGTAQDYEITYRFYSAVDMDGQYIIAALTEHVSGPDTTYAWASTTDTLAKASSVRLPLFGQCYDSEGDDYVLPSDVAGAISDGRTAVVEYTDVDIPPTLFCSWVNLYGTLGSNITAVNDGTIFNLCLQGVLDDELWSCTMEQVTVPALSDTEPQALGTASAGSSDEAARADHIHAKPTYTASDVGALPSNTVFVSSVNGQTGAVTLTIPSNLPQSIGFGYGTTSTNGSEKLVTMTNYQQVIGGYVAIKFESSVPADCKLYINGTGAKYIRYRGSNITADFIQTGDIVTMVYASTQYNIVAIDRAIKVKPSSATPQMDSVGSAGSGDEYALGNHVHPSDTSKADKITTVTVSSAGAVTQALDAGKVYTFTGALTSLTITFNATSDLPQYHFIFTEGSTAFDPTLPSGTKLPDSHTWEADTRYEVDILDGYAVVQGWAVS